MLTTIKTLTQPVLSEDMQAWFIDNGLETQKYIDLLAQFNAALEQIETRIVLTDRVEFGMLEATMGNVNSLNYVALNDTENFKAFIKQFFNADHYGIYTPMGVLLVEMTRYFWKIGTQDLKFEKVGKRFFNRFYAEKLNNQFFVESF